MTSSRIRLGFVGAEHLHFGGSAQERPGMPDRRGRGLHEHRSRTPGLLREHVPRRQGVRQLDRAVRAGRSRQAIITCADNLRAAEVVAEAAERGVHVMKEKPMAATLAVAEQMATTAARHGVRLMINWPSNWSPAIHHAKTLVDEGRIGRVWQVHHRAGHGGPPPDYLARGPVARVGWGWLIERETNGGGAAIDFCSYGAVLSRWIMGQPSRVTGMGGRYSKDFFTVDDNAIMILGYPARPLGLRRNLDPAGGRRSKIPAMIYGDGRGDRPDRADRADACQPGPVRRTELDRDRDDHGAGAAGPLRVRAGLFHTLPAPRRAVPGYRLPRTLPRRAGDPGGGPGLDGPGEGGGSAAQAVLAV